MSVGQSSEAFDHEQTAKILPFTVGSCFKLFGSGSPALQLYSAYYLINEIMLPLRLSQRPMQISTSVDSCRL